MPFAGRHNREKGPVGPEVDLTSAFTGKKPDKESKSSPERNKCWLLEN
jgi:hypothetical protein